MSTLQKQIYRLEEDIKTVTIQGATNVALATLEGIRLVAKNISGDRKILLRAVKEIGEKLSNARVNEPLARNAVKYIFTKLNQSKSTMPKDAQIEVLGLCTEYESMIAEGKKHIVAFGAEVLNKEDVVLTHCHSSTTTKILINVAKLKEIEQKEFKVVSTETRPLYQGRKTAKELFGAGVDITQIVDSACASFIVDDRYLPVGAIIVGCDELLKDGSFINKVGTYSIALSAEKGKDKFYVATHLLKMDPKRDVIIPDIEQRAANEIWDHAPKGLKIINPAFEHTPSELVTGYITEAGLLTKDELLPKAEEAYPWLFTQENFDL